MKETLPGTRLLSLAFSFSCSYSAASSNFGGRAGRVGTVKQVMMKTIFYASTHMQIIVPDVAPQPLKLVVSLRPCLHGGGGPRSSGVGFFCFVSARA